MAGCGTAFLLCSLIELQVLATQKGLSSAGALCPTLDTAFGHHLLKGDDALIVVE